MKKQEILRIMEVSPKSMTAAKRSRNRRSRAAAKQAVKFADVDDVANSSRTKVNPNKKMW